MRVGLILSALLAVACAQTENSNPDDVRAVVNGILDADNRADIERVLSYYDSDAVLMPPGRDEIRGIENIRRNYENIFATSVLNLSSEEETITLHGDLAIYKGRTKGKILLKSDSSERNVDDKFIMILKSTNGTWKISTLIWN